MKYTELFKTIFNEKIEDLLINYLDNHISFRLVISNKDNWNKPLPDNIKSLENIIIDMKGDSLEDTYYCTEKEKIFLSIGINSEQFVKYLDIEDVLAILDIETQNPVLVKPFKDEEFLNTESKKVDTTIDKEGVLHSLECFRNYNPEYNIDSVIKEIKES